MWESRGRRAREGSGRDTTGRPTRERAAGTVREGGGHGRGWLVRCVCAPPRGARGRAPRGWTWPRTRSW
eukprot:5767259-Prymnesium_polylepis.1